MGRIVLSFQKNPGGNLEAFNCETEIAIRVTCTNLGKEIGIKFQHKLFEPVN
jgi:hypothetical protein